MDYIEEDKVIADVLKKTEELFINYVNQAENLDITRHLVYCRL